MLKKLPVLITTLLLAIHVSGQLRINEAMTANVSTIMDDDDEFSDWIEIYNAGSSGVNLFNYGLSDDFDSLAKWKFPSVNISSGGFLIVWCSGKDKTGSVLHTNFKLDNSGENIYLSNALGSVIDNLSLNFLPSDKTFGRLTDGSATIAYLSNATFGTTNNISTLITGVITTPPDFNIHGGFYTTPQNIILSHSDTSCIIRYTLDGSDPTENSPAYTSPINVHSRLGDANNYSTIRTGYTIHHYLPDWNPPLGEVFKCNIIRARAFKAGYFEGPIKTYSYFIDPNIFTRYGNLPVISVVSDPKNLFNDTTGIYVPGLTYAAAQYNGNYSNGWQRPANIEMYNPGGQSAFNGNFKIDIGGESSQSSPQKGLNVTASSDYGPDKVDYPIFQNTTDPARFIQKFDKIKLRAWGSDRKKVLFRDAYPNSFMSKTNLDYPAYQPCVVFIDGEYWGLQEIRERNRSGNYYEDHYLIDKNNPGFDILDGDGNDVDEGDAVNWDAMISYINSHPMSVQSNYDYIKTQMDVDNYMVYFMCSIYLGREDWPGQNEMKWRAKNAGSKWKWIQWDMDNTASYDLYPWSDMFDQVLVGNASYGPSDLLIQLMTNVEFKNNFVNIFADYMNTNFLSAIAQARTNEMSAQLRPYMQEFEDRWQLNSSWESRLDSMNWWLDERPDFVKEQIIDDLGTGDTLHLTLNVSDSLKGNIKVNSIFLDGNTPRVNANVYPWTGVYFQGVPVLLTAIAKPGFRFVKWLPGNDTNRTINVNLIQDSSITALFGVDVNYQPPVLPVINEVMSANVTAIADNYGDFDDWLEIYNPGNDTIDLAGYYLSDNLILPTRFKFLGGTDSTKITPHGFLLVWIDDDIEQGILHTPFKFNSSGDFIALVSPDGESIVDSLSFQSLSNDVSFGRSYDAAPTHINFNPSTPNATNWIYTSEKVFINELQTINTATYQDNYGDFDKWIELYNPNADTVDIAGWKISNDPANTSFHVFEHNNDSTLIKPYGFKMLWSDTQVNQGVLHLNFSLQQSGCVKLYKPNQSLDDSICYSVLISDQSFGRETDGNNNLTVFVIPTPDSNNVIGNGIFNVKQKSNLKVYPNPLHAGKIYFNEPVTFDLFDALGQKLAHANKCFDFDMNVFEKGIYFLKTDREGFVKVVKE